MGALTTELKETCVCVCMCVSVLFINYRTGTTLEGMSPNPLTLQMQQN